MKSNKEMQSYIKNILGITVSIKQINKLKPEIIESIQKAIYLHEKIKNDWKILDNERYKNG